MTQVAILMSLDRNHASIAVRKKTIPDTLDIYTAIITALFTVPCMCVRSRRQANDVETRWIAACTASSVAM